jgi:hypothetical protein
MSALRRLLHWLAHKTGRNEGHVVSKTDEYGRVLIGFQCSTCHVIEGVHVARTLP